jgi:hypothetical protein
LPQLTLCTLTNIQEPGGTDHIVPVPRSTQEAYLLLEAAHADRGIILARNSLTRQIIHHNTLVLQYNRMVLEQAQDDLHATDRFVGEVCFLIRKSGQSTAYAYAMQQDHLPPTPRMYPIFSCCTINQPSVVERPSKYSPSLFDVDLT